MSEPAIFHESIRGAGDVVLHVARAGKGAPVILLHGFPEDWRSWRRQIQPLAEAGFSVWMPDLRGYGMSDKPAARDAYHLRHLVDDVAAIVQATSAGRAHVVGHDWGGVIAWTFAGTHPGLIDRLAILNAPHMRIFLRKVRRPAQMFRSIYVLFFQLPWLPEKLLAARDFAAVREMFRRTPARRGAFSEEAIDGYVQMLAQPGALRAALDYYRANFLSDGMALASAAATDAPVLVVWGERDLALSPILLDGLDEVAPRVRIHRIPDAGHWVQHEAPDEVNSALIAFLREDPARPADGGQTAAARIRKR